MSTPDHRIALPTPGGSLWNQRAALADSSKRLTQLMDAVGRSADLVAHQWSSLFCFALDFEPDLIIELGRGYGNSTCVFTEAAARKGSCRVASICVSRDWTRHVEQRVRRVLSSSPSESGDWFDRLEIREQEIGAVDWAALLGAARRVFVFWDAHGYDVADCIFGTLLPLLESRDHVVAMHDIFDHRFFPGFDLGYAGRPLWRGNDWEGPRLVLGNLTGSVEQIVSAIDFASRNGIALGSADESLCTEVLDRPERVAELERVVGEPFFSDAMRAHWIWFTLAGSTGPLSFPRRPEASSAEMDSVVPHRVRLDVKSALVRGRLPLVARLRLAVKLLLGRYES